MLPWPPFSDMLFSNICRYVSEKQLTFKCVDPETTNFNLSKTLHDDSSILVRFAKSNFKVDGSARFLGGTGGTIEQNVQKWSFSQSLSRYHFPHFLLLLFRNFGLNSLIPVYPVIINVGLAKVWFLSV